MNKALGLIQRHGAFLIMRLNLELSTCIHSNLISDFLLKFIIVLKKI